MKRIAIMGCSGSGKSTLASKLGERLRLPVTHLDVLNWQPGWTEAETSVLAAAYEQVVAQDEWIVEGGYNHIDPDHRRYRNSDVLVLFDLPVWLCLWRVIKRTLIYHGRNRPDMGEGCPERFEWGFMMFIWNYRKNSFPRILERARKYQTPVVLVKRDMDLDGVITAMHAAQPLPLD